MAKRSIALEHIKFTRGISRRLIIYIVSFSSLVTLIITALQLYDEYVDGVDNVKAQIAQVETLSLPGLTENLWNLYEDQIQIQLDGLMQHPDLLYLEIRSKGKSVALSGTVSVENTISQILPIRYRRDGEIIQIGELLIVASLERVHRNIMKRIIFILLSNASKTALVSVFIFVIFQFLVTRHLVSICEHLQRLSPDHFGKKLSLNRRPAEDELQQVVTAINQMESNLDLNIKERKRAEEELLRKERLANLGELTGTVSHELRNPLGTLRNAVVSVKRFAGEGDALLTKSVALAERSITRIDNVIADLFDYSRDRPLRVVSTKLDDWLALVLDDYAPPQCVTLRRELSSGATVNLDQERFWRVVVNLLDNACQAMVGEVMSESDQGEYLLTVTSALAGESAEISVSDTGPGIAPENVEKLFEPLYSTKSFGVGLGLAIVKRIVDQHEGSIDIESQQGRRTRVVIRLPLCMPQQKAAS
jgi:signal transduction histidine kinase